MVAPLHFAPPVPNPAADRALGVMRACQSALDLLNVQCAPDGTAARIAAGKAARAFAAGDWNTVAEVAAEMLADLNEALRRQWASAPATEK